MATAALTSAAAAPPAAPLARSSRALWLGFGFMLLGNFMAILDIQIVSSSLRDIQAGVSASNDEIAWVQTAYLIAEIIVIPLSGLLGRALSIRTLFCLSAAGFTLSSVMCALSWNMDSLIVFRALQGFLGGAMIPTTTAALFTLFPPERRGPAMVLIGMVSTVAPSIGPTIGGWLTDTLGWHWLFLINVLPGTAAAVLVWQFSPLRTRNLDLLRRIDALGLAAMALMLGSLEYVLEEGPRHDWLQDTSVLRVFTLGTLSAAVFFWRSLTQANPIVNLRVFANRNFVIGCCVAAIVGCGLYGSVYLIPLFLGQVRGYSALEIGRTMFVSGVVMFFTAPLIGRLQKRYDARWIIMFGLAVGAVGLWFNAHLNPDAALPELILPQALRGFGLMMAMIPMIQIAIGTLPPQMIQDGSGLFSMIRNLGGALGLAAINTILERSENFHRTQLADAVSNGHADAAGWIDTMTAQMSAQGMADPHGAAVAALANMVEREVFTMAFNDVFLWMSIGFGVLVPVVMLARKGRVAGGPAAAGH